MLRELRSVARRLQPRGFVPKRARSHTHTAIIIHRYVVDSLIAETEQGRALRDIRALDSGFDEFSFITDMRASPVFASGRKTVNARNISPALTHPSHSPQETTSSQNSRALSSE